MTRTVCVLARTTGTAPCSRCLGAVPLAAGAWIAAEPDATHRAVCDRCSQRDDPGGYAALLAWRRAAAGHTTGRRAT